MKKRNTSDAGKRVASRKPRRKRKDSAIIVSASDSAGLAQHIYGLNPVLEALRAGQRPIEHIAISESARPLRLRELLELARKERVPIRRVPRLGLKHLLPHATHQGVIAKIAAVRYADADELLDALASRVGTKEAPLGLGLDGVEDPHNLGAILRTAECAGIHGVFMPERRTVGLTNTVAKAAAGALEYVKVARVTNLVRLIERLKERNIWVVGAATDGAVNYTDWDWRLANVLFLGSEGSGLQRLVRERCDALLRIPVCGQVESLNVSVAAGILLYEAQRQRAVAEPMVGRPE
jgi:23S rRNA (guanosine2251-2'-O)-methyltransferase